MSPRTASVLCYIPTVGWIAAVAVMAGRNVGHETQESASRRATPMFVEVAYEKSFCR
jgi:hypothetical protein